MKLSNKIYNWWHGVRRIRTKGSKNAAKLWNGVDWVVIKYDWSKPFAFTTKTERWTDWKKFTGGINIKLEPTTQKGESK